MSHEEYLSSSDEIDTKDIELESISKSSEELIGEEEVDNDDDEDIYPYESTSPQFNHQGQPYNLLDEIPSLSAPQPRHVHKGVIARELPRLPEEISQSILSHTRCSGIPSSNKIREQILLKKFENEVLNHEIASKTFRVLRNETQEKYLYQIRRYICHCANKGLDNFYVNYLLVKELIENEIQKRGQITENTIKSLRSSLNKLYHMNRIVYSTQQPHIVLGDNIVQEIMSSYKQQTQNDNTKGSGEGSSSSSSTPLNSRSTSLKELSEPSNLSGKPTATSSASTSVSIIENKEQLDFGRKDKEKEGEKLEQSPGTSDDRVVVFKLSTSSKIKLSPEEEYLLQKFNNEVLDNSKTAAILSSLTVNTFKSYATDMKRFIRFCARQGKTNTFIEEDILKKFLAVEVDKSKKNNSKKLRTSLLKLHQLNCQAYDIDYSEGDIVFLLNKYVDGQSSMFRDGAPFSLDQFTSNDLSTRLDQMLETTNLLRGLTAENKILHRNEFKRYASFCSNMDLDHFHVNGDSVVKYFQELAKVDPNITEKKLRDILRKLNLLHSLNEENFENYPTIIENSDFIDEYLKKVSGHNQTALRSSDPSSSVERTGISASSGVPFSISSLTGNVPTLFLNDADKASVIEGTNISLGSEQPGGTSEESGESRTAMGEAASTHSTPIKILPDGAAAQVTPIASHDYQNISSDEIERKELEEEDDDDEEEEEEDNEEDHGEEVEEADIGAESYQIKQNIQPEQEEDSSSASDDEMDGSISKSEDSSDASISHSKRQKLEPLPQTSITIPPFVMNGDITTVAQLVEEWSLIVKRTLKWGLGWIKNQVDFGIYKDRKIIINFIEEILLELDEQNRGKSIDQVDEDQVYDVAKVFDQYITRREITLDDLIRKIDNNPVYSKKEFLRILTRRQTIEA